jgi:ribosomal protein L15
VELDEVELDEVELDEVELDEVELDEVELDEIVTDVANSIKLLIFGSFSPILFENAANLYSPLANPLPEVCPPPALAPPYH